MNILEQLAQEIGRKEQELEALLKAYAVLGGTFSGSEARVYEEVRAPIVEVVESRPMAAPPVDVRPQRPHEPVDTRLLCAGCGGRLEPATRELKSGKVVSYLMCMDSSCNNEVFA